MRKEKGNLLSFKMVCLTLLLPFALSRQGPRRRQCLRQGLHRQSSALMHGASEYFGFGKAVSWVTCQHNSGGYRRRVYHHQYSVNNSFYSMNLFKPNVYKL